MTFAFVFYTLASAMANVWPRPEFPHHWQPPGYLARRSPKKRAVLRARTGRK